MRVIPAYLLRHSVTVENPTGSGAFGIIYDTAVGVPCHVTLKRVLDRNETGATIVYDAVALFNVSTTIVEQAKITWNGIVYQVTGIEPVEDMPGHIAFQRVLMKR